MDRDLRQICDVFGQTRLVPGSGIPVYKPFIDRLVDKRNCRIEQLGALGLVRCRKSATQTFDLRSQLASVASVDQVPFLVLTNPLFR